MADEPNYDDIRDDTGLAEDNMVFASLTSAETVITRWIAEQTYIFNLETGWDYATDKDTWDVDFKYAAKICIEAMVKKCIYARMVAMDETQRGPTLGLYTTAKKLVDDLLPKIRTRKYDRKVRFIFYKPLVRRDWTTDDYVYEEEDEEDT